MASETGPVGIRERFKRIPGLRPLVRLLRGQPMTWPREYLLAQMPAGSVGAEIGVHEGDFSATILRVVRPSRLHLIDPWEHFESETYQGSHYGGLGTSGQEIMETRYQEVLSRFADEIASGQVVVHRGLSEEAATQMAPGSLDWVYIDGNHLYEYVLRDLERYDKPVKPGGLIMGDDYGTRGWWENGVERAVATFMEDHPNYSLTVRGDQFLIRR